MADAIVGLDESATIDKMVDCDSLTVGANTVYRQRIRIAGSAATDLAPVDSTYGLRVHTGALSTFRRVATGDANAVNIKASAGVLRHVQGFNKADYPIYIKFHNTAGTPTAGSGVVYVVGVQAGQRAEVILPGRGKAFATGLAMTMVKDMADSGTTVLVAEDGVFEVGYE